jgi:hypothetical protein
MQVAQAVSTFQLTTESINITEISIVCYISIVHVLCYRYLCIMLFPIGAEPTLLKKEQLYVEVSLLLF